MFVSIYFFKILSKFKKSIYLFKKEAQFSVNNVVCSYSTKCHLNLRKIAKEGMHVEYKKENGVGCSTDNYLFNAKI